MANLLALLGAKSMMAAGSVAVVATGTAIVYKDEIPKLLERAGIITAAPEAKSEQVALTPPADAEPEPKAEEPQAVPVPKVEQPQIATPIVPTFDVLRVEEDGSILVAGNAAPNSSVELMTADGNVIGRVQAGAEGDFVILPDNLLPPGDYVMSLRATVGAEEPILSQQSSVITVPEKDGEVLAMISEAGKPSRIVAKPEVLEETVAEEPAIPEPVAESPQEPAPVEEVKPAEVDKPVEEEIAATPAPAQETTQTQQETAAEPEIAVEPEVAVEVEAEVEPATEEVAKVEDKPEPAIAPAEPAPPPPSVVVEAVEVEDGQVYVAGGIKRGVPVRIYIDNEFIGLTRGTSDDRFLVSRQFDLSEGEHAVRADVIDSKTGAVIARAEVPLIHELPDAPEPEVEIAAAPPVAEPPEEQPPVVEDAPAVESNPVEPVKEVSQAPVEPAQPKPQPTPEPVVEAKASEAPEVPKAPKTVSAENQAKSEEVVQTEEVAQVAPRKKPMVLKTGRAVIIKRGDNLWRISRKTYGRGIRYTTIYKANRSQIRDPHRIYIGQIFKIPENAEREG